MISKDVLPKLKHIWQNYVLANNKIKDLKGNDLENIDPRRLDAIETLRIIVSDFISSDIDLREFRTDIDSFNKQNNLWGFTSIKGQMFFNVLLKTSEAPIETDRLTIILKDCVSCPTSLSDALNKINVLETYCLEIFSKAKDRRKAPNPSSIGYFLSYFWQIADPNLWPIMYTSTIIALSEIGLWQQQKNQVDAYRVYFSINEEIRALLSNSTGTPISNWDLEHALWNFKSYQNQGKPAKVSQTPAVTIETTIVNNYKANFQISDYIIPKVAKLIELGSNSDKSAASKGAEFEKLVAEIFRQLDFEVEFLGQGSGRNPDAILRFREDNTAFLVDAKAYSTSYNLGVEDRAIKEYIHFHCPRLQKEGYKKIGFILVSNAFKSSFETFVNDITWNSDIRRFILLTSEALLYLLAYKTKEKLPLSTIVESLVTLGNVVQAQNVIEEFDDF